jgi:hypothetical protein
MFFAAARGYVPSSVQFAESDAGGLVTLRLWRRGTAVRGRAIDERGAPVAGAHAVLVFDRGLSRDVAFGAAWPSPSLTARTDHDGRFEFDAVPAGEHPLRVFGGVRGVGHTPVSAPDDAVVVQLRPGARVAGTVRDAGGQGIPGARLEALAAWDASVGFDAASIEAVGVTALTDERGRFALQGLLGPVELLATAPGRRPLRVRLPLAGAGPFEWSPILDRGLRLAGAVRGPRGEPCAEWHVRARALGSEPRFEDWHAVTGADGSFAFDALGDRAYVLQARPPGTVDGLYWCRAEHRPGTQVVLEVAAAAAAAELAGKVVAADGSPLGSGIVRVSVAVDPIGKQVRVGRDGTFRVRTVPPGIVTARVADPVLGVIAEEQRVAAAGAVVDLGEIRAAERSRLSVSFAGAVPARREGLFATLTREGARTSQRLEGAAGEGVLRAAVPAGRYTLRVLGPAIRPIVRDVDVAVGVPADVAVELEPGVPVQLALRSSNGAVVGDTCFVVITDAGGRRVFADLVDQAALAGLTFGLAPGKHRVEMQTFLGFAGSREVIVPAAAAAGAGALEVEVELSRAR